MIVLDSYRAMCIYENGLEQEINDTVQEYNDGDLVFEDFCNIMEDLIFQRKKVGELKTRNYNSGYF